MKPLLLVALMAAAPLPAMTVAEQQGAPETVTYRTVAERDLRLFVFRPATAAPRPCLLIIHGGGWGSGEPGLFTPEAQYFASRGMVAVTVEYRLATKDSGIGLADCLADCRAALTWLRENPTRVGIDPARIVVAGDSAGGQLAAMLALSPTPPAAVVLYNPCCDLAALKWVRQRPEFRDGEAALIALSPIEQIRHAVPPMLLVHGTADEVVPVAHADRFVARLRSAGSAVVYRRLHGWRHAFVVPNYGSETQVVDAWRFTDRFLAELGYLDGAPTITTAWRPQAYKPLFSEAEKEHPHVTGRSFALEDWPFLDGQWEGIVAADDHKVYFSFSSHSQTHHAQVFRYDIAEDRIEHLADLGEICGETDGKTAPQDKIHSQMFDAGEVIYCGTCEGHSYQDLPYAGGYWLAIEKATGTVRSLGKSIGNDGLITVGWDAQRRLLYGHTNRRGRLLAFDPGSGKERDLGFPWQGSEAEWPRGLTLMVSPSGNVYGARWPACSFWEFDRQSGRLQTLAVDMPAPAELRDGNAELLQNWQQSAAHITTWQDQDQCFYFVRSFDEMLCRFQPPRAGQAATVEALRTLRPEGLPRRYGNRLAACTLVIHDRTVYYTPYTGWGGETHLVSYHLDTGAYRHYGPIIVEGGRRVNECHSMAAGADGKLYLAAFVFSIRGIDAERPWAMRDKYPFHSRFVVVEP